MPVYEFTPAKPLRYTRVLTIETDYSNQDILDWLVEKGVPATEVAQRVTDDDRTTYLITSDIDPRTVLAGARPPRKHEQARQFLTTVQPKLQDGTATAAEQRNAVLAMTVLLGIG